MLPPTPGFERKPTITARPGTWALPVDPPLPGQLPWSGPRLEMVSWPLVLRFRSAGRLLPWLGPALRGLLAFSLKRAVCFHPPSVRDTLWRHCEGCPKQRQCPVGATFEPPDTRGDRGRHQAPRPVVLAPEINTWADSWHGMELRASLLLAGARAMAQGRVVLETLRAAGRERGLGLDAARFDLDLEGFPTLMALGPADLPDHPEDGTGMVPRVTVVLRSPLFLRARGSREPLELPGFTDLFLASFRAVEHLLNSRGLGMPLDMTAFLQAADLVRAQASSWMEFTQPHFSSRGQSHHVLRGVVGGATFGPVPAGFLPWLIWGGRMHAGDQRVSGAGGWRVVVE